MSTKIVYVEVEEKLLTDHKGRECGGCPGDHVIEDVSVHEFQIRPESKGFLLQWLAEEEKILHGKDKSRN